MQGLKAATDKIRQELIDTGLVNNVEISRPDDFLQEKKNFFPAVHVDYEGASTSDAIVTLNMQCVIVDIVDEDLQNEEDVLNATLAIAGRIQAVLQRSEPSTNFNLDVDATLTRVYEQGSQNYAGWVMTFPLKIVNESHNEA